MCLNHAWGSCGSCTECRAFANWKPPHGKPHEYTLAQREYQESTKRSRTDVRAARIAALEAELARLKEGDK